LSLFHLRLAALTYLYPRPSDSIAMVGASKIAFKRFSLRMRLVGGALFAAAGSVMFSFVRRDDQYFPLVFPGLIIGSSGKFQREREDPLEYRSSPPSHSSRQLDILRICVRGSPSQRSTQIQRVSSTLLLRATSATCSVSFSSLTALSSPLFKVSSEGCGTQSSSLEQQLFSPSRLRSKLPSQIIPVKRLLLSMDTKFVSFPFPLSRSHMLELIHFVCPSTVRIPVQRRRPLR